MLLLARKLDTAGRNPMIADLNIDSEHLYTDRLDYFPFKNISRAFFP